MDLYGDGKQFILIIKSSSWHKSALNLLLRSVLNDLFRVKVITNVKCVTVKLYSATRKQN